MPESQSDRAARSVRVFGSMVALVHEVSSAGARELGSQGRTPAQFQALRVLGELRGCTQQRLAEALGVTKGNVSQLLGRLVADGLVEREADGAAYVVRLTPAGQRLLGELVPAHREFLQGCFSALGAGELRQLERMLDDVRRTL